MKKLTLLFIFLPFIVASQNIDSLNTIWNDKKQHDTTRLVALNKIAWFYAFSNPDTSRLLSNVELKMAEEKKYPKWIGNAWNTIGVSYWIEGNYPVAIECFHKSIAEWEKIKFIKGLASSYHNIGLIHKSQGEGKIALSYFLKSLEFEEKIANKKGIAESYNNIALMYSEEHILDSALHFLGKARELWKEADDPGIIGTTCMVLGAVNYELKNYQRSRELVDSAIVYFEISGDKKALSSCGLQLTLLHNNAGEYPQAIRTGENALAQAKEVGSLFNQKDLLVALSKSYSGTGDHRKALEYYQLGVALKDSIINEERKSEIARGEEKFKYDRKALADSLNNAAARQIKDAELAEKQARLKQEEILRYSLYAGIIMLLGFGAYIFNRYKISQRQKMLISEQKAIVEHKQREVMDSIHYARKIQRALLKDEEHTSMHLPEHFIYYMPKDIVSGDFYWAMEKENNLYLAVGDCTGHGVPGAMLTMLGTAFLNEINSAAKLLSPAEILNELREKFLKELSTGVAANVSYDGMDISLIQLDLNTLNAKWAGANSPLWYVRNKELHSIKANPQPIGFYFDHVPFTEHNVQLQKGDCIYLFSDGYADQFGGPQVVSKNNPLIQGKKFKSKNLAELLTSIAHESVSKQREVVAGAFESWKGNLDQIDDVTVFGMKL